MINTIKSFFQPKEDVFFLSRVGFPPGAFFTQAELDQLKAVLSECIMIETEIDRKVRDKMIQDKKEFRAYYQKDLRKGKKRIKLLANLQQKVKHSIVTMQ